MKDFISNNIKNIFSNSFYNHYKRELEPNMKNKDFKKVYKLMIKNTGKSLFDMINFLNTFNKPKVIKELNYISNKCYWYGKNNIVYYIAENNEPKYKFAHYEDAEYSFLETNKFNVKIKEISYVNGTLEFMYWDENANKVLSRPIVKYDYKVNKSWNNGKDEIKSWFFKPKIGYLYFIKIQIDDIITNKIGISSKTISERFSDKRIKILSQKILKMPMVEAATIEKALHKELQPFRHYLPSNFGGSNECYRGDIFDINMDIEEAKEILDIDNYLNIPKGIFNDLIKHQRRVLNE